MNNPVAGIDAWVDSHTETILSETQAVLRIASVKDETTVTSDAPFGKTVADALDHTLRLCERLGMRTRNLDGFIGDAEFGDPNAPEYVAMLGHLDVVPAGNDWTFDPWGATVKDGEIYGRGTSDDKGPTYAALWGAKALLDVMAANDLHLTHRVRLIFGCDEESDWRCTSHYFQTLQEPMPILAFTPDAFFPLVHAEKGSFTAHVRHTHLLSDNDSGVRLVAFRSGLRPNMVPDRAEAKLIGNENAPALQKLKTMADVTVAGNNEHWMVTAVGKSAHGSDPFAGDNAAVKLLRALASAGITDSWLTDLADRGYGDGAKVGIAGSDEITGKLTSNLGVVDLPENGDAVIATFNIRYPATWNGDDTTGRFTMSLAETGWSLDDLRHTPPLYVPLDKEPVNTLMRIYRERTGDKTTPAGTMGGRTYATAVAPVGVAFGAAMPGDPHVAHEADEHFSVERLLQCAKIYGQALYEMASNKGYAENDTSLSGKSRTAMLTINCVGLPGGNEWRLALQEGKSEHRQTTEWGADAATFLVPVLVTVAGENEPLDFKGSFVQGVRSARFVYLCWLNAQGEMRMRTKIPLAGIASDLLDSANGTLTVTVSLTDRQGKPRTGSIPLAEMVRS